METDYLADDVLDDSKMKRVCINKRLVEVMHPDKTRAGKQKEICGLREGF